ncbi:MAG: hypothetical protein MJA82_16695 [Clostridia bacterium]|nr:hypothetical protein [Clostridia bacterium]
MLEKIAFKKATSKNKQDENISINIDELIAITKSKHQIKFEMLKGRSKNREIIRIKDDFIKKTEGLSDESSFIL